MSYLLKIDAILVCIGCVAVVCNVNSDVVIIAIGKVDVATCCVGWRFSCLVDFDVVVAHTVVVKTSVNPAAPTKCVTKPAPRVTAALKSKVFAVALCAVIVEAKIAVRYRERNFVAQ
jgi:hypothetical protein